jgi:Neocarzinostatin family
MRSTKTVIRLVCVLAVLGLAVGACSSSSSDKKSSTTTTKAKKAEPTVTVTPATGLTEGATVHVTGKGFTPDQSLGVNECKVDATNENDCNIREIKVVKSDAKGEVSADIAVHKGPFGGNNIVCSAQQKCLVSVSQLKVGPTEEADTEIAFAG